MQDGDTGAEALTRECQEELDVLLEVGEPAAQVEYEYPDVTIHLSLPEARIAQGELRLPSCNGPGKEFIAYHNDVVFQG